MVYIEHKQADNAIGVYQFTTDTIALNSFFGDTYWQNGGLSPVIDARQNFDDICVDTVSDMTRLSICRRICTQKVQKCKSLFVPHLMLSTEVEIASDICPNFLWLSFFHCLGDLFLLCECKLIDLEIVFVQKYVSLPPKSNTVKMKRGKSNLPCRIRHLARQAWCFLLAIAQMTWRQAYTEGSMLVLVNIGVPKLLILEQRLASWATHPMILAKLVIVKLGETYFTGGGMCRIGNEAV